MRGIHVLKTKLTFKALAESARQQPDKIPAGWRTVSQVAKAEGRSLAYVREGLERAVASKSIPKPQKFKIPRTDGNVNLVLHYKI